MARVLIVGCGCRGRSLAGGLLERGLAVRGTTRDPARTGEIEAAGAEAAVADPDRLGTLLPHLQGVTFVYWLMATAGVPELHGERLRSLLEKLVDTPVRGFVYEAGGGEEIARAAGALVSAARRGCGCGPREPRGVAPRHAGLRGPPASTLEIRSDFMH